MLNSGTAQGVQPHVAEASVANRGKRNWIVKGCRPNSAVLWNVGADLVGDLGVLGSVSEVPSDPTRNGLPEYSAKVGFSCHPPRRPLAGP